MEQHQRRARRVARLSIEDLESLDGDGAVARGERQGVLLLEPVRRTIVLHGRATIENDGSPRKRTVTDGRRDSGAAGPRRGRPALLRARHPHGRHGPDPRRLRGVAQTALPPLPRQGAARRGGAAAPRRGVPEPAGRCRSSGRGTARGDPRVLRHPARLVRRARLPRLPVPERLRRDELDLTGRQRRGEAPEAQAPAPPRGARPRASADRRSCPASSWCSPTARCPRAPSWAPRTRRCTPSPPPPRCSTPPASEGDGRASGARRKSWLPASGPPNIRRASVSRRGFAVGRGDSAWPGGRGCRRCWSTTRGAGGP